MGRWSTVALVALLASACADSPTDPLPDLADPVPDPPDPLPPAPRAEAAWAWTTRGFDDSPLRGELRLLPPRDLPDWTYSVDLDGDGEPEEEGPLGHGASVLYRYEKAGPHTIGVLLERGGERYRADQVVVVNDPAATRVLARERPVDDWSDALEDIAYDPVDDVVYVLHRQHRLLLRLDARTLAPLATVSLPGDGYAEGMAVDLERDVAYVNLGTGIAAYSLDGPIAFERMVLEETFWGSVFVGPDGSLYFNSPGELRRIDPVSGETRARAPATRGPVAFDPAGDRLVHVAARGRTISVLDRRDLAPILRLDVPDGFPSPVAAAFAPDGEHLYVLLGRGTWHLLVIRLADGGILRDVILGRDTQRFSSYAPGRSTPSALSANGRFVVFSTGVGAFFVRVSDHVPLYRTMDPPVDPNDFGGGESIGCCNVAASPDEPVFFFSNRNNSWVTRVELTR